MESSVIQIEKFIHKKIELYQSLVEILGQEKKSLRQTDVDALWRYSEEKQAIAKKIKTARQEILSVLDNLRINHGMDVPSFRMETVLTVIPEEMRSRIRKKLLILNRTKAQVDGIAKVNKAFVEEYLNVLDEMIGIIANAGNPEPQYTRSCSNESTGKANLLLHREV